MQYSSQHRGTEIIARVRSAIARAGIAAQDLFLRLDVDGDGCLTREELITLFLQFQRDLTSEELRSTFNMIDGDANGHVDLHEFCNLFGDASQDVPRGSAQGVPASVQAIIQRIGVAIARMGIHPRKLFDKLDANSDGILSATELERLLVQLQPNITAAEVDAVFRHFDYDRNGKVSMEEFSQTLASAALDAASSPAPDMRSDEAAPERASNMVLRLKASMERMGWAARDFFAQVDTNRDGKVSIGELEHLALQLQPDLTARERQLLFDSIDLDRNGGIDVDEFCAIFELQPRRKLPHRCADIQPRSILRPSRVPHVACVRA